ncbi:MAG: glycosyltransferase [Pseudomonadota bacterium]
MTESERQITVPSNDPEARFRRLPGGFGRWTASTLWRLWRLKRRRARWLAENRAATAPYRKAPRAALLPEGPGLLLGDFGGDTGISRAALYEAARLEAEYGPLERVDIARLGPGEAVGPPVARAWFLLAPDSLARGLATLPPERLARAHRTALWAWETPQLAGHWVFGFDVVHQVWTPSAFARAAVAAAAPEEVTVGIRPHVPRLGPALPRAETLAALGAGTSAEEGAQDTAGPRDTMATGWAPIPKDAFLGLAVMDIRTCPARKNPWAHIAAWQAAFGTREDRVLILKIRFSKRTAVVRRELERMIGTARNIRLVEHFLPDPVQAGLQAGADVYLSLHRAEGYGLNIHECLARGTPVVATDWSANAEYGPAFAGYHPVPARLVPYRDWTAHYPDAFLWAEADLAHAARQLRALAARASHSAPPDATAPNSGTSSGADTAGQASKTAGSKASKTPGPTGVEAA